MTNNERIAKEIMGWRKFKSFVKRGWTADPKYHVQSEVKFLKFDQDLNACHLMEEKIREKGLEACYIQNLKLIYFGTMECALFASDYMKTTKAQRVAAAIQMLNELKGSK